jgi:hypothetical protein
MVGIISEIRAEEISGLTVLKPVYIFQSALEIDISEIYQPGTLLDMPKRPPWNHSLTKEKLESREEKYFHVSTVCWLLYSGIII